MKTIEPKVIYVAGPMTGLPELNRPAFMEAEKALTEAGFVVLNPAWLPVGLPPEKYMPICLAMLDAAEAVYMLEGWERSHGALIERSYALYQGKAVFEPEKGEEKMSNEEFKGNIPKVTTGVPEMLMAICEMLQRIEQKLDRDYYEGEWMVVDKGVDYGHARPVKVYSPMHVGGGGGYGSFHDLGASAYGPQGACGGADTCTTGEKGMTENK